MTKNIINCKKAPAAIGPYSQAVEAGSFLFISGQLPIVPDTGQLINGGIEEQTLQCLQNIKQILYSYRLNMDHIVKVMVFLKDLNDFGDMNKVYGSIFPKDFPARVCVEVSRLPKDAKIEIDAIALTG